MISADDDEIVGAAQIIKRFCVFRFAFFRRPAGIDFCYRAIGTNVEMKRSPLQSMKTSK